MTMAEAEISVYGVRRYCAEDARWLFEAARESTDDVYPWMSWCHPGFSMEDSARFVESREGAWSEAVEYSFVLFDRQSKTFVGGLGLNRVDAAHRMVNLAYWVRSSRTGRGAASAGARLVAQYGFEKLGFRRIEIVASVEQTSSQRVAEKIGANKEGILQERLLLHGRSHDAVLYSLLPQDLHADAG